MKLGIVGGGVVGKATARSFIEHVDEVRVHDIIAERSTHTLSEVLETDLVCVCLPTPLNPGTKSLDTHHVDRFFSSLPAEGKDRCYALRSTVPVGTTLRLSANFPHLVHWPEFLTARCSVTDAHLPTRHVVGNPRFGEGCLMWSEGNRAAETINVLLHARFPGVPFHLMSSNESEAVKIVQNGFFAVKIAFFNEARTLCDAVGLNWKEVLAAVLADGRIARSHTSVPGPDGWRGFGGTCLPKDLSQLVRELNVRCLRADVSKGALFRNPADRGGAP